MSNDYTLSGDIDLLSKAISSGLKALYDSTVYLDKTEFWGETSRCQIDTYQIYSIPERGYITVNIYYFSKNLADSSLYVKVSAFPPVKDTSAKAKKILSEIEKLIVGRP